MPYTMTKTITRTAGSPTFREFIATLDSAAVFAEFPEVANKTPIEVHDEYMQTANSNAGFVSHNYTFDATTETAVNVWDSEAAFAAAHEGWVPENLTLTAPWPAWETFPASIRSPLQYLHLLHNNHCVSSIQFTVETT